MADGGPPKVPPPSALPDFSSLARPAGANPFAPRPTSGVPPPPSELPAPPSAFAKPAFPPGETSNIPHPASLPHPSARQSPSPSPLPSVRPTTVQNSAPVPSQEPLSLTTSVQPGKTSHGAPIKPVLLSPVATAPSCPPPQIDAELIRPADVPPTAPPPRPAPPTAMPPGQAAPPQSPPVTAPPTETAAEPNAKNSTETRSGAQDQSADSEGMMGWLSKTMQESKFLAQVAEKAKVGMETVLTTLDPGMKDFLSGDGVVEVYVGTEDPMTSSAVRQGFERVFSSAVVRGVPVPQGDSAPLCFGLPTADSQCKVHATRLAASRLASPASPFVVLQPCVVELGSEWFFCTRLLLRWRGSDMTALSQLVSISSDLKAHLQRARSGSPREDGGFPVTVEQAHAQLGASVPLLPVAAHELLVVSCALLAADFKQKVESERAAKVGEKEGK